jgi:U3 small nucleolar RNA-associated protein 10
VGARAHRGPSPRRRPRGGLYCASLPPYAAPNAVPPSCLALPDPPPPAISAPEPQSKALSAEARGEAAAAAAPPAAGDGAAEAPATPVLSGCLSVMRQALLQLQALHPTADAEEEEEEAAAAEAGQPAGRRPGLGPRQRAVNSATRGLYGLLGVLRGLLEASEYLQALLALAEHPSAHVVRRALGLFADRVAALEEDEAELGAGLDGAGAAEARGLVAAAAMGVARCLPALADAARKGGESGAVTLQAALVAADAAIARFGALRPADALAALPPAVSVAADAAAPPPLRGSALGAVASAAAALGPRVVPALPGVAAAALAAAEAAIAALDALGPAPATPPPASNGEEEDSDEEPALAGADAAAREDQGLLLAAALAALEALVGHLGPFMSPYLPRLLAAALAPAALACAAGGAAGRAARLRAALPEEVPPRLLVEPVAAAWDAALASCRAPASDSAEAYVEAGAAAAAPAVAHLKLVAALAGGMDHKSAAAHADALFALLLRALDTRQRQLEAAAAGAGAGEGAPAAGLGALRGGGAAAVEAAACGALVALVMKLSEARFKPLFLRLVDWAAAASAAGAGAAPAPGGGAAAAAAAGLGRVAALLAATCALSHRLRSVFAPYFKYILDLIISQLLSPLPGEGGERPAKKRRKSAAAEGDADAASAALAAGVPGPAAAALAGWLCRVRAMRALHLLAAHAGPGPMEHERFARLLSPLARQLAAPAPPANAPPRLAAALSAQTADAELDGALTAAALLGPAGVAAANAATGARAADAGAAAAAAPPPAAAADAAAAAAAGALVALGLAAGNDAAWKPLTHAVLSAARAARGPAGAATRTKLLALGVVSRLVAALREEWLVLVPEVLPFLAELVEDGEPLVEAAAQGLLAQLEEVSGEKLDAYLRA